MHPAEDGSEDQISTPAEIEAGTLSLAPTMVDADTILPAPTKNEGKYDTTISC